MNPTRFRTLIIAAVFAASGSALRAHDAGVGHEHPVVTAKAFPFIVEQAGPVKVASTKLEPGTRVSGSGYWKFIARRDLTPTPEAAMPSRTKAHNTLIVDKANCNLYWPLVGVGWIGYTNQLAAAWIIKGDSVFDAGTVHGADILQRPGKPPLVAAADNVSGKLYLTDTTFQHAQVLSVPQGAPYNLKKNFAPTDAAFVSSKEVWFTDGYAQAWLMPVNVDPFEYQGRFYGGKTLSGTPHGITYRPEEKSLLVAARPEGLMKRFPLKDGVVDEIDGLPPGSTVCGFDIWGDYALAPCLDGANQSAGPIYIINLKKRAVVATIKAKEDLGYEDAQHIHDACWYVTGKGDKQKVFVVFTNWNPGGIGTLELVNLSE
jgi:hypothetical protein